MQIRGQWLAIAGAVGLVVTVVASLTIWRAEAQVMAHQKEFLRAVEDRKAKKIDRLLAANYADAWGFDRLDVLLACDDLRRCFLAVGFAVQDEKVEVSGGTGSYQARLRLQGSPVGAGQFIRERANRLREPFVFTWRKAGWLPWDWRLHRIDQVELTSLEGYEPGALRELLDIE